jgi:hypothetical protein
MTQEEVDLLCEAVFAKPLLLEQAGSPTTKELMTPEPGRKHKRQKHVRWTYHRGPQEPPMKVVKVEPTGPKWDRAEALKRSRFGPR